MSGTTARSNVVPMPTNGAPPTAPVPWPQPGVWPMPNAMAGCCPPSNLMQCYCDIQNATAFICAVMVDCINTNPAVAQAMIDAIQKSGSNLPLLGVTNGTPAQPGQVGEFIRMFQQAPYVATGTQTTVTMGVLQPGDWLVWSLMGTSTLVTGTFMVLNPIPVGFADSLVQELAGTAMGAATALVGGPTQALISVPTLVAIQINVNTGGSGAAGTANVFFNALRVR